ncbi:hypothetical protein NEMBOFW57_008189 [Staphylotrichum longicolle]|uniref:Uncharacterized protein n=1 Tax=Staphylotrichum longicolle TaxID=669026 RepID=A0AAD4ER77_9PEZI|nr:hypothetical protein NEMBOFW57_008189 [Staphylotrichum longicolle]
MATKWLRYYFENKAQAEIECYGGTAKLAQLRFWPTAGHAFAGLLLKTLAAYHVGFVLTYLLSLYVVFLSKRGAEKVKQKAPTAP